MSNVDAPDVNSGETNNPDLLVEQSGIPATTKKFTIETDTKILGDLDVTGTVTATSFIGDGSQLTGISGGGPQSEIISGDAFVRIEEGDPDGDSAAPVNLKMVSIGGTDLWDVDVSSLNDINISSGDDITISAGDWMELQTQNEFYITSGDKIDLETDEYIELNGDVYLRDGHPLRLQDDFAGVNPGMESFVQDLDSATSTEVPSAIAVKSVTDDLQSQINNLSGGGGLDSAAVQSLIDADLMGTPDGTVQIGDGANAGQLYSTAIGYNASTSGFYTIAIGENASAQGGETVSIGRSTVNSGLNSVALGRGANIAAHYSVAIGDNAEIDGANSIAIGRNSVAGAYAQENGTAIGEGAEAKAANTIVISSTGVTNTVTSQYDIDIRTSAAGSLTYDTTNDWTFGAGVTMTDLTASGATVVFSNLPTTDPVNAGQLWNDNGTLKVSAG